MNILYLKQINEHLEPGVWYLKQIDEHLVSSTWHLKQIKENRKNLETEIAKNTSCPNKGKGLRLEIEFSENPVTYRRKQSFERYF